MIVGIGRPCRRPTSKSFGSCAGVILTAPDAERRVDVVVGDDRDAAPGDRHLDLGADQVLVALVVRVHRDRRVAQHRLDPRGGDDDGGVPVAVAHGDELAVDLEVVDLDVRDRAAQRRGPVDQALGAVDQSVVVHPLEHGADGAGQPVVEREPLALTSPRRPRGAASGRGSSRRTRPSTPRPSRRTPPGRARAGPARPRPPSGARRRTASRCRRGPCRAATARRTPACDGGGSARRSACGPSRARGAGCR